MRTIRAGLIGYPVEHSVSPRIFETLGRALGCRVGYKKHQVKPKDLASALSRLRPLAGLNVTIPHKEAVLPLLSGLTPQARAIGAVNAIRFTRKGGWGENTDADGFADALRETGVKVKGAAAMIYGAGGAARAVGYALGKMGAGKVTFKARTERRARKAAKDIGKAFPRTKYMCAGRRAPTCGLHINATPLGMKGFPRRSPAETLSGCEWAFDLVYGRRTPFLKEAARVGAKTMDGSAMLVYQALRAWQFWGGRLGGRSRKALKNDISRDCGFGKFSPLLD